MKRPILDYLVDVLIAYARRNPYFHLAGYMNRYWVLKPHWWTFGCSIRVHHILRSDDDRHLHDHPWPFMTLILRGGYTEVLDQFETSALDLVKNPVHSQWPFVEWQVRPGKRVMRAFGRVCPPGTIICHRATARHRLFVAPGKHAWTLFFMGPRQQEWGFYTETGKVSWRDYLPPDEAAEQRKQHVAHGITE